MCEVDTFNMKHSLYQDNILEDLRIIMVATMIIFFVLSYMECDWDEANSSRIIVIH